MKTKLLITGLAFMAMTTLVSAQNRVAGQRQMNRTDQGTAFVDANKDGVCDNFETAASNNRNGRRLANTNSCGNRGGMVAGQGRGTANGQGRGMGPGQGRGTGQGGKNFVDADKNGICDSYETASKK